MLPDLWLQHEVTVADRTGTNGIGEDTYGTPYTVPCFAEHKRRVVRDRNRNEVISESAFYADPRPEIPAKSRVTFPDGTVTYVITMADLDGGDLPLPSHIAVYCE